MLPFVFQVLLATEFDLLVESYSKDAITGKIRGKMLMLTNFGFLPAPFFAGLIVDRINFGVVFFLASLVIFVAATIIAFNFSENSSVVSKKKKSKNVVNSFAVWKKVKKQSDLFRIYALAFLLQIFYAATVVYVPLLLLKNDIGWEKIGLLLTSMLVPFVVIQYPVGLICDKIGEKEVLVVALSLMIFSAGVMGLMDLNSFWLILVVLLIGRTGAALFEVGRDAYFYKKISAKDVDLISFFRSDQPLAYIAVAVVFGILSFFFEISVLFVILAIILLIGFIPLVKIKDTK